MFEKPNGVDYVNHHKEKLKQRRKKALMYLGGVIVGSVLLFHNDIPGLKNPMPYKAKPKYAVQQDSTYRDSSEKKRDYRMEVREPANKHITGKTLDSLID